LPSAIPSRPIDATLSVTKAARLLGVHPNTVRAWSDAGRLRYYRINPRGDRRYRVGDLQRFLTAAEGGNSEASSYTTAAARRAAERAPVEVIDATVARGLAATDPDRLSAAADRELDLGLLVELGRVEQMLQRQGWRRWLPL